MACSHCRRFRLKSRSRQGHKLACFCLPPRNDDHGQDALKESFPDMPRADRQLLMLRFVREMDQSVDYDEVGALQ